MLLFADCILVLCHVLVELSRCVDKCFCVY